MAADPSAMMTDEQRTARRRGVLTGAAVLAVMAVAVYGGFIFLMYLRTN